MEFSHANGSAVDWTYLLGELASTSKHTLSEVQGIRQDLADLHHENTQRQIEHAILKTKHESLEAKMETPSDRGLSLTMLSDLMERGGEYLEWGKAFFKALLTVRDLTIWAVSGTALYKLLTHPLEIKHLAQGSLGWIGLSF